MISRFSWRTWTMAIGEGRYDNIRILNFFPDPSWGKKISFNRKRTAEIKKLVTVYAIPINFAIDPSNAAQKIKSRIFLLPRTS